MKIRLKRSKTYEQMRTLPQKSSTKQQAPTEVKYGVIKRLWSFLVKPRRGTVIYGGRGSAKSWSVAAFLVLMAASNKYRILCCREVQVSIKDSVHTLLKDTIYRLKLQGIFEITDVSIRCPATGSEFIFKGLKHNINDIRSTEGIDICWVEEAHAVSEDSWRALIPTIRKAGSRIIITFNPDLESDATYQRFVIHCPTGYEALKINYDENPFLSAEVLAEASYDKEVNPEAYDNVWLGNVRKHSEAQVFAKKYEVREFKIPTRNEVDRFFIGVDWGFAKDPTTIVLSFIREGYLYICREGYGVGVDTGNIARDIFSKVPEAADKWPIYADCARPETISFIRTRRWNVMQDGKPREVFYNIQPAKKWKGSVEDGIAYLKGFKKIIIHPSCVHTKMEFDNYSYEVDKNNGDVLPKLVDKYNHCIDAIRYSLDGYITNHSLDWLRYYDK